MHSTWLRPLALQALAVGALCPGPLQARPKRLPLQRAVGSLAAAAACLPSPTVLPPFTTLLNLVLPCPCRLLELVPFVLGHFTHGPDARRLNELLEASQQQQGLGLPQTLMRLGMDRQYTVIHVEKPLYEKVRNGGRLTLSVGAGGIRLLGSSRAAGLPQGLSRLGTDRQRAVIHAEMPLDEVIR